ncbi:glycosyltransferase family 4 protein [Amycolatopsis suaedae]|uniref:Glycosyltransferase family 1 protein n=1 Tax=Amycolatopsis suaedae TaxID=2510978 RepID=A0A4Q7JEF1_9PSEU|nr:glycosyltransferase family 4 protein [Amycolatopsis suaedae]RZQ65668.1 glycosyltransferase family 1 protein [Amycolatopsis suaedae]
MSGQPLRIALLTYRGNPRSGGQGVYVRHLSRELTALGHRVEVISGPPYPDLDPGVPLTRLPGLDLFAEPNPFRTPALRELRTLPDWVEFAGMRRGGFPEPLAFSLRAAWQLRRRRGQFDIVHDNQGLGYGLLACGLPVVATVHHPIAVDRRLALADAESGHAGILRWYGFLTMQHRVARRLPLLLTVSEASRAALTAEMGVEPARTRVVPLAPHGFAPTGTTVPGRIVTTASADEPLKGLRHLLAAMPAVRQACPGAELIVVGKPKPDGPVARLAGDGRFVHGLTEAELAALVSSAEVACVPSLFEGFCLPAVEAMAAGTPVVATTGGALPEVVGEAGMLVPPGDPRALAGALVTVLTEAGLRRRLRAAGLARAAGFSWRRTAEDTVRHYRDLLAPRERVPVC